jgi:hypothetical protein
MAGERRRGTDGTADKFAAAVRADPAEEIDSAGRAEGALE